MSYNSLSTIFALIPGIAITFLFLFGKAEHASDVIKKKATLIIS